MVSGERLKAVEKVLYNTTKSNNREMIDRIAIS